MRKFWMVVGDGVPYFRHETLGLAEREAERLALLHRGSQFTVVEAVATVRVADVLWEKNDEESDIPF